MPGRRRGPARWVDRGFELTAGWYGSALRRALDLRWAVLAVGAGVLASTYFLYVSSESELAPTEDQGFLIIQATAVVLLGLGKAPESVKSRRLVERHQTRIIRGRGSVVVK